MVARTAWEGQLSEHSILAMPVHRMKKLKNEFSIMLSFFFWLVTSNTDSMEYLLYIFFSGGYLHAKEILCNSIEEGAASNCQKQGDLLRVMSKMLAFRCGFGWRYGLCSSIKLLHEWRSYGNCLRLQPHLSTTASIEYNHSTAVITASGYYRLPLCYC
jgi:hypothetical protein